MTILRLTILSLFFLSGAAGLAYQITWMRMFRLVMGNTVFTSATVLTVFMAGLAGGAYLAGRLVDRVQRPLTLYGLLEGLIGLYGLAMPLLLVLADPGYAWLYGRFADSTVVLAGGRFAISAILLIVPTTLMGATLPLLSRVLTRSPQSVGRDVGRLYAFNTLGAAAGAGAAGFVLIPLLGVRSALLTAVALNFAIAAASVLLARRSESRAAAPSAEPAARASVAARLSPDLPVVLGVAAAGFAAMIYEVAWTRTLVLLVGSSVYAFTLMLVAFIAGLGAGGMVLSGWIDRRRDLLLFLGGLELLVAFGALAVVPLFNALPVYMVGLVTAYASSFSMLTAVEFLTVFALMLLPTFAMGGVFPAVARIYARDLKHLGRSVGEAYAANTVGAVCGSFAAGFLLIPNLGVQRSIWVAVGINTAIGIYFLLASAWRSIGLRASVAGAAACLVGAAVWQMPAWDTVLFNSAPYLYAYRYKDKAAGESANMGLVMTRNRRLLYAEEGMTATVTVVESGGELYLKVNGKTDASSRGDLRSQSILGHLPLLLHDRPDRVLLVGLGSGITLGALEQHPVQEIDCVEISPEVVAASRWFGEVNGDALSDPRVRLVIGDGRNHVAFSPHKYDVIVSQPSNLWIAGMADLFTSEFFTACRRRLSPGGLMCSWVQAYSMRVEDFKSVIRTFRTAFPHVSMWESVPGGDYFLIGSDRPLPISYDVLKGRIRDRGLHADLERIGVRTARNLVSSYVMDEAGLDAFAGDGVVNTDDNAVIEFSAPKGLYQGLLGQPGIFEVQQLAPHRRTDLGFLADEGVDEELDRAWRARRAALEASVHMNAGRYGPALAWLEEATRQDRDDMELQRLFPGLGLALGDQLTARGEYRQALALYRRIVEIVPDDGVTHYRLGKIHERLDERDLAVQAYERSLELEPRFVPPYLRLAAEYARSHMSAKAASVYRQALAVDPRNPEIAGELGKLLLLRGDLDAAIEVFSQGLALAPEDAQLNNNMGVAHAQKEDWHTAISWYRLAFEYSPDYVRAHNNMGDAYRALGEIAQARGAYEAALSLEPSNLRALRALKRMGRNPREDG